MSVVTVVYRFFVANVITVFSNVFALMLILINTLKNPFKHPWPVKLNLMPPASLFDPIYGAHNYVKANSIKLHYVESGDSSKPLMLFIHGFPEFWYSWRHQIIHFNKEYRCVAVDMRGYGDSERPESVSQYKIELLVDDIVELIQHLGHKKCIVVAHDWGGVVACQLRETHPEVLDGLVILSSTSLSVWRRQIWTTSEQMIKSIYYFMFRLPMVSELLMQMHNLDFFDKLLCSKKNDSITEKDIQCYKYWFGKQMGLTPPINYYRANFGYTWQDNYFKENVPFLMVHGENEKYLSRSILEAIKKQFSTIETVILEGCGHFMQQEEPEKVNNLIKNFLVKHNL